ncbi:hypothetical protein ACX80U_17260 [Arthrobacter sp. TmT3-37]
MAVDRKSTPLSKAPRGDVIDTLPPATQGTPSVVEPPEPATQVEATRPEAEATPVRAPRRPKRILLPFSSKIEMNLREEMDAYIDADDDLTIVSFLDEAIRDRLAKRDQ